MNEANRKQWKDRKKARNKNSKPKEKEVTMEDAMAALLKRFGK